MARVKSGKQITRISSPKYVKVKTKRGKIGAKHLGAAYQRARRPCS